MSDSYTFSNRKWSFFHEMNLLNETKLHRLIWLNDSVNFTKAEAIGEISTIAPNMRIYGEVAEVKMNPRFLIRENCRFCQLYLNWTTVKTAACLHMPMENRVKSLSWKTFGSWSRIYISDGWSGLIPQFVAIKIQNSSNVNFVCEQLNS